MEEKYTHEHQLQADCVIWFAQEYPEMRGSLWGNFSEQGIASAGKKLSLGLVKDLPDIMFRISGMFCGVELKLMGSRHPTQHLVGQAWWLEKNTDIGCFCDSLDGFKCLIKSVIAVPATGTAFSQELKLLRFIGDDSSIIHPLMVIDYCKSIKTKTTTWNKENFIKFAK